MSLSSLSTALDALVVAAGFRVAETRDPLAIPAHRASKDLVVDIESAESGRGAASRLERYVARVSGLYPETVRTADGTRTALAGLEAIRDALCAASALATVPARVLSVEMAQEPTGTGAILVSVVAEIHASR